jgi:hypothetical protein
MGEERREPWILGRHIDDPFLFVELKDFLGDYSHHDREVQHIEDCNNVAEYLS